MAKVTVKNVSKIYPMDRGKEVTAVRDVSLEVADREFLVLVGPSGCGKSTTLRMIAGLEEISRGDIFIGERRVNDLPPKDRDVAMVFQSYALYPHMSVYDNLAFSLKMRKYPEKEIRHRVGEAAAILGIEPLLARQPKTLSGGQRQRIALGRAIVRQPKVFLFDEPLSNLDAKMRVQMRTEISRLHQRLQATVIYVTHDQVEAMTMGSRIAVMHDGVIQQTDAPLTIYHQPANLFVASFLGSPAMNLIPGRLSAEGDRLVFKENEGVITLRFRAAERPALQAFVGQEITAGIRPEDLELSRAPRGPGEATFQAVVDLVEPTGAETNVYLQTGGARTVVCRTTAVVDPREVGHRLPFQISDLSKVHLFDPLTTNRIQ